MSIHPYTRIEYARFADDLVILVEGHIKWEWLVKRLCKRLLEEFSKVKVEVNGEKTRIVDLKQKAKFGFLGFEFRRVKTLKGKWGIYNLHDTEDESEKVLISEHTGSNEALQIPACWKSNRRN